ncbi:MAG: hypothetical protein PHH75_01610 [Candidatus Omnitrophica bacterium]|jgi:choline-glycine betaine transporter|nr:hypothetical protein [Candidatus Omnitrophota bacterium]MDD5573856.1 hypothetical protein [Candidatus Omnitrophota bacterium]
MNKKQIAVILLGIIALVLIFFLTPRYKITSIGGDNYIITEQSSSLYERSQGAVKLHWEKISLYGGIALLACGGLAVVFRRKK